MKELSPTAKALIQSGKGGVEPSPADRDRVLAALQQRIAAGEGVRDPGASSPPVAVPKPWGLISAGGIGAGLVAGALAWGLGPRAAPPTAPPPVPQIASAPPPVPSVTADPPTAPAVPEVSQALAPSEPERAVPTAPARSGPLAEEVAILSRATAALHAGHGEDALRAIAEHQRKFPSGLLIEERRSARAQALCLLGRTSEAKRELDRLSPTSPQAVRARQRCGL